MKYIKFIYSFYVIRKCMTFMHTGDYRKRDATANGFLEKEKLLNWWK